ncbi:hypothetical protein GCM10008986_24010 [Salinibacillus aidingensis]|uniref:Selenoprotein W-related protein n=1 Tax=Salinibacillus aidingensis TaxID=237684 RepID=A0ABP3LBJ5_9BACI
MKLIPGSGGVFEISVNEETIYSKKETGIFPDPNQIIEIVEDLKQT